MQNKTHRSDAPSGIVLYAKQRGMTSFASLSTIKKALNTTKVGHTGTLDAFADGLLVVLTGSLTRLVPHITGFDKDYLALIEFGTQTDTLDPTGMVVSTAPVPSEETVRAVLPQFIGDIEQVPPAYSAIHIGGSRASDLVRAGKPADIPPRRVTIYSLHLLDYAGKYALVEVRCSKGTYIRALARDIATACGSCAHLAALRRVAVGPFRLSGAAGSGLLGDFTISALTERLAQEANGGRGHTDVVPSYDEIRAAVQSMTAPLAELCGFVPTKLSAEGAQAFANGRPLKRAYFYCPASAVTGVAVPFAAFTPCEQGSVFAGVVEKTGRRLSYGFVLPHRLPFAVYSWEQLVGGRFNAAWRAQGTALTVGSFDGPHFGHESLFTAVCAQKQFVPGVITFSRPLRGLKKGAGYAGDVTTLSQRLVTFSERGFAFAIVIDFSATFAKLTGADFLSALLSGCGMRFLAEGADFRCGYHGATDVAALLMLSKRYGFDFTPVAPVLYGGERISSSRIRQAVLAGDFAAAAAMLHHPFALDCAGWDWKRDGTDLYAVAAAVDAPRVQLLPHDGTYPVSVQLTMTGTADAAVVLTDCTVEAGTVRLTDARYALRGSIQEIAFS